MAELKETALSVTLSHSVMAELKEIALSLTLSESLLDSADFVKMFAVIITS